MAEHGDRDDVRRARAMLERIAKSSSVRATPALTALFDSFESSRFADKALGEQHAVRAAELFKEIGWPMHEARALELLGRAKEAREIYAKCGATRETRRLDAALNPVNKRGRAKGDLTAREREICDLLVQGKTNKTIADQLVVSERTVESHVSSILMKMNAASRAELIAKLR
ncbi:MAG: hypothetical protein JO347_07945 [Candidatus Eremiobacteraeota bacterium]|nr:hypothetical protein [Candidatus Eremiobacteraeota bacterium]